MKKGVLIGILIMAIFTSLIIYFQNYIIEFVNKQFNENFLSEKYEYGEADGEFGKIKLKVKTDEYGAVKELYVIDYDDSYEDSVKALQILANNSKNKYSADDIDVVSGATVTSLVYKKALNNALHIVENKKEDIEVSDITEPGKVSLADPNIRNKVERKPIDTGDDKTYYKTGLGVYIKNNLTDAEYNKDGDLATDEYICGVMLQQNDRIMKVKFDHMSSNMVFTNKGYIPTGTSRLYSFFPDSQKQDFVGYSLDENGINLLDFENVCIKCMSLNEVKKHYFDKKAYEPYVLALEQAILNAKNLGAKMDDTMGISCKKVLDKKNIVNANEENDGYAIFNTYYSLVTIDNELNITSCIIDSANNNIGFTNKGNISGSKNKEVHTISYLTDAKLYSKSDSDIVDLMYECNIFSNMIKGESINSVVLVVSENTDSRGKWINKTYDFSHIDFLTLIDILTDAFLKARKI